MQKRTIFSVAPLLTLVLGLGGCELETDHTDSAIVHGDWIDAEEAGLAFVDDQCTLTLLEDNVGLTTRGCANFGREFTFAGETRKMRGHEGFRLVVDNGRRADAEVVAVHVEKSIHSSRAPYGRRVDTRKVLSGENLICRGFYSGIARSGYFHVEDSSDDVLHLRGLRINGSDARVNWQDIGGYCTRDSDHEIVAILSGATKYGIAEARRLEPLRRGVENAVFAAQFTNAPFGP